MKVFILLGSDDYRSREILDVYTDKGAAEQDIKSEKFEEPRQHDEPERAFLISRQGKPIYEIVEKEVNEPTREKHT